MILIVTPNPAIDRILTIPKLQRGKIHRASQEIVMAGGKGVNAARTISSLGGEALCMGFLGGYTGQQAADLVKQEGLLSSWTWVSGETRTCTIVLEEAISRISSDDGTGSQAARRIDATVLNPIGSQVIAGDWEHLRQAVLERAKKGDLVAFSGSLPPGSDPADLRRTLVELADAGCKTWVDTSGAALRAALQSAPTGIKVNGREIGEVLGIQAGSLEQAYASARLMQQEWLTTQVLNQAREDEPGIAVITLGAQGAVLCQGGECWAARPPKLRLVSSVGSGDTFFGALLWSLEQGMKNQEALRRAVAAGAANALIPGSGQFYMDDYQRILKATKVNFMGSARSRHPARGSLR